MTNLQQEQIDKIAELVKQRLSGEGSGHDWWHIYRVWQLAKHINIQEQGDDFVVQLAALLHDIADWKFHNHDENIGPQAAKEILQHINVNESIVERVCDIVGTISFLGAGEKNKISTLEGKIVQDVDRLDAIGAIGIARTFAYGGYAHRPMYNPEHKPSENQTKEEYMNNNSPTINHFYEKLLLLKDRMNTKTGREIAENRHAFMEHYLDQFYAEWEGIR